MNKGLSTQFCVATDINKILLTSEVNNTLGTCQTNKKLGHSRSKKDRKKKQETNNTFQTANTRTQKSAEISAIDKTKT